MLSGSTEGPLRTCWRGARAHRGRGCEGLTPRNLTSRPGVPRPGTRRGYSGGLTARLQEEIDHQAGSAEARDAEGLLRRPHCAVAGRYLTSRQGTPRPGTRRGYSGGLTARLQEEI